MAAESVNPFDVPEHLRDWFAALKSTVIVKFQSPAMQTPHLYEGRLKQVAATGAFIVLTGVQLDDGQRRSIMLPLDYCALVPKRYSR